MDGDAAVGFVEQHDEGDDQHADEGEETDAQDVVAVEETLGQESGESGDDAGEDDEGNAVADAALGDQFAEPYQQHCAGGDGKQGGDGGQEGVSGEAYVGQDVVLLQQH